jgi:RND superfamily putative drug exporter
MRLAGDWNWWAPRSLRRFHDRWGIRETISLDDEGEAGEPAPAPPAALVGTAQQDGNGAERDPGAMAGDRSHR